MKVIVEKRRSAVTLVDEQSGRAIATWHWTAWRTLGHGRAEHLLGLIADAVNRDPHCQMVRLPPVKRPKAGTP